MPLRILCLTVLLLGAGLAAGEPAPVPADDEGWGDARDGLACRVIIKPEFCLGEALGLAIEFKNVSEKERTLLDVATILNPKIASLNITGPNGAAIKQHQTHGHNPFGADAFRLLAPGAVKRLEFLDIRAWYGEWNNGVADGFRVPGEYTLTYINCGAAPVPTQPPSQDGKPGAVITPSADQIAKAWSQGAVSKPVKFTVRTPTEKDLSVHEWGVFTIHSDVKLANAALKAEWASLPDFFYRQYPKQRLRWSPAQWDKPIVYFYTALEHLSVNVKLAFAAGAPVVWWPACRNPHCNGSTPKDQMPAFTALEWSGWLGETLPQNEAAAPTRVPREPLPLKPADMPKDAWLNDARGVAGAALFSVLGTPLNTGRPWGQYESERFIYYDGIVPAPDYLSCTAADVLKNNAAFAIKDLFVVDRREVPKKPIRFAHVKALAPGQESKIEFTTVAAQDWPAYGSKAVNAALTAAGLTPAETQSVLKIWNAGFFNYPGVTAFYVLPQSEYDRMLPLDIYPPPGKTVRVGIALHPGIDGDPELTATVRGLIKALNAENFDEREAAKKALAQHGGIAIRELRKTLASTTIIEVRENCRKVLSEMDASTYLEKK